MPLGATMHQLGAAVMLVAFFAPRLFDYSQCTRACRVHYGEDSNWFKPASITGTRKLAAPSTCSCSDGGTGIGDAPRYLEPVPTSEQEPYWGGRVCAIVQGGGDDGGDDGGGGSGGGGDGDGAPTEFSSLSEAKAAGARPLNCGGCGPCSTSHDTGTYRRLGQSLTRRATVCGVTFLLLGEAAAGWCMDVLVGLRPPCRRCWTANMGCTTTHCFRECVLQGNIPFLSKPNRPKGALNPCFHCDEVFCSPYFLRSCGANRRTAGVATDIQRPGQEICKLN